MAVVLVMVVTVVIFFHVLIRSLIYLIAQFNFIWLLLQASYLAWARRHRDDKAAWSRWPQRWSRRPPATLWDNEQWAEHKNGLEERRSKLLETCTKTCRKLLLLQAALSLCGAQCQSQSAGRAQIMAAAQPLWLQRCAKSRQRGEGCHLVKAGGSRNILLQVLRSWRKPWLLT